ncbi:hypothetical protein BLS_005499 [Venturia inaequalis]|uniref:Uncharacterized protein n=1 Tax=Venturia inaequalis TaxID=5025 RepID=A0A8H3YPZ5_VENIN|nr:hypothetical protein BLS_005499 [Venturia inaequalis]KAE9985782.1 hypothetical protein EG328_006903 [Venturia inaequalis]KAE9993940.1 hypothetical protein EG327_002274 [Venturia inaequalis]
MSGPTRPSTTLPKPQQSPYIFLDIHDAVIQGLIHFTRQPEIGHSPFDTFDLWLYILNLGFPREQGFYTKFYHESPPQPEKEKAVFDERAGSASSDEDEDEDDGSGGIMIEVWKVEGYYTPARNGGNVWVTTKNEVLLLFFCHESSWDMIEMPMSRLKKELRENVIPIQTPLQTRLVQKCKSLIPSTPTQKGIHTAIACGSSIRLFKWKTSEPEWLFCHVNWHVDLGSGVPSMSAKAVETFIEGLKEGKGVK